jgi:hypothetical protein
MLQSKKESKEEARRQKISADHAASAAKQAASIAKLSAVAASAADSSASECAHAAEVKQKNVNKLQVIVKRHGKILAKLQDGTVDMSDERAIKFQKELSGLGDDKQVMEALLVVLGMEGDASTSAEHLMASLAEFRKSQLMESGSMLEIIGSAMGTDIDSFGQGFAYEAESAKTAGSKLLELASIGEKLGEKHGANGRQSRKSKLIQRRMESMREAAEASIEVSLANEDEEDDYVDVLSNPGFTSAAKWADENLLRKSRSVKNTSCEALLRTHMQVKQAMIKREAEHRWQWLREAWWSCEYEQRGDKRFVVLRGAIGKVRIG